MNKNKRDNRYVSYEIICDFLAANKKLSLVIDEHLTKKDVDLNNIPFVTEICYGVIRYYFFLEYLIISSTTNNKKIKPDVLSLLLIGSYQLLFMNSVPSYAAINTTVNLCKIISVHNYKFVNAILRKISEINLKTLNIPQYIKESFPEYIYNIYVRDFGKKYSIKLMKAQNERPIHWGRINKSYRKVLKLLNDKNIDFQKYKYNNNYLEFKTINNSTIKKLIKNGLLYIQSPSSGHVIDLLDIQDDDVILDGCCSPGGKFSDIYFKSNNSVILHGFEKNKKRFLSFEKNISRMKIKNVNYFNKDFINHNDKDYNKIIIDVPCSGTGSINKKPDIKVRLNNYHEFNYNDIQTSLLNHAAKIIKHNGIIIYSTCSLNSDENWSIIDTFLNKNDDFTIQNITNLVPKNYIDKKGALFINPLKHKLDGMFAVKLKKIN